MASGSKKRTVQLVYPIIVEENGEEIKIKKITLRRLKLKHLKAIPKSLLEDTGEEKKEVDPIDMIPIIAIATGLTEDQAGEIDLDDLVNVSEEVSYFLKESLQTGTSG